MKSFFLRHANQEDISALLEIENTCFRYDRISRKQMRYILTKSKMITMVACVHENEKVIAYAMCFVPPRRKVSRIYSLAVMPEFRGMGIAKQLLSSLISESKAKGFKYCHLEVRESDLNTQKLYKGLGFSFYKHEKNYYEDGEAAIRMRAEIGKSE